MAMKASAAPSSTTHSVVNAIVLSCGLSCFTFALFTMGSILLILSVFGLPSPARARTECLFTVRFRRTGH